MENRLLDIRKRLGMTQEQLADELGITQANVSHIETEKQILTLGNASALVGVCAKRGIVIGLDDIFIYPQQAQRNTQKEND